MVVRGGDGRVFFDKQVEDFAKDNGMLTELPKGNIAGKIHLDNWFDCIKTRKDPSMDMESGHRVASMCILANIAYRLERTLRWSPMSESFLSDPSANALLRNPGRGIYNHPEF
jgi:hypothetical protein